MGTGIFIFLDWENGIWVTQGMTDTKMGMGKPKYHYKDTFFLATLVLKRAIECRIVFKSHQIDSRHFSFNFTMGLGQASNFPEINRRQWR